MFGLRHPFGFPMSFVCTLLAFSAAVGFAQTGAVESRSERKAFRNLVYVTDGHERQKLDVYLPAEPGVDRPLLVWIHGGGWEGGSKERCPALGMLKRGYVVAFELSTESPRHFPCANRGLQSRNSMAPGACSGIRD